MSERATPTPARSRLPGAWTATRDVLSFLAGWALVFMEVRRPEIRESVMVFAGVAIGFPGLAIGAGSLLDMLRSRGGTDQPSSPSAQAASPPSSPS